MYKNHNRMQKSAAILLCLALGLGTCFADPFTLQSGNGVSKQLFSVVKVKAAEATGIHVNTPSQAEIRAYAANIQEIMPVYKEAPDFTAPYAAGALTDATLQNALDTMNLVRYIAGVPYDVSLNAEYTEKAQAASMVNFVNNQISHFPTQPAGMSDELYALGKTGARSSNLGCGWGYRNGRSFYDEIIHGWMNDGDSSNIDRVGHRRWVINPSMKQTGFGTVWGESRFQNAMYAFDNSYGQTEYYGVAWPAQNMPVSFFNKSYPWSISMGTSVSSDAEVTLTRISDQKTWTFKNGSTDFYINNENYGQEGCIIFHPSGITGYQAGDEFDVSITGTGLNVQYSVHFFSLADETAPTVVPTVAPTTRPTAVPTVAPTVTPKPESNKDSVSTPGKVVLKSVKNKKGKKAVVTWKKLSKVSGYRIEYAYNRKFTAGKKTKNTISANYTLKSLKKGKTCYIRVCAYRNFDGGKIYGSWSKVKKIKIKK